MSGGGGDIRFDGPGDNSPDCEALSFTTPLNSPVPAVVKTLKKDDRLEVQKVVSPKGIVRVEVVSPKGQVAGSITSVQLVQLISCIDGGHEYVAVVTNTPGGGLVNLRIQSAKKP